jgi:hypothetical protein
LLKDRPLVNQGRTRLQRLVRTAHRDLQQIRARTAAAMLSRELEPKTSFLDG